MGVSSQRNRAREQCQKKLRIGGTIGPDACYFSKLGVLKLRLLPYCHISVPMLLLKKLLISTQKLSEWTQLLALSSRIVTMLRLKHTRIDNYVR